MTTRNLALGEGYSKAFGENTYVGLKGMRTISHELVHALKDHLFIDSLRNSQEIDAMKTTNRIIKQHHMIKQTPALAGERNSYTPQPKYSLPKGAIIKD